MAGVAAAAVLVGVLAGAATADETVEPGGPNAAAAVERATAPGCSLAATGGHVRRTVGGRSYQLYVPPGLAGQEVDGVPLVVALHG
ncbi:hypothetical protein B7486_68515, partial [cyanobacterium TDX16]